MDPHSILGALFLGAVQGITEFLPISSSAHLIVLSYFLDGKPLPLSLNVALHMGTFASLLIFFWRDWLRLAYAVKDRLANGQKSFESDVLLPGLILGTIPAALVGFTWEDQIEQIFHRPEMVAAPLALIGILLWLGDRYLRSAKNMRQMSIADGLRIGVFQALALIPGVSRSGISILGARVTGLNRGDAAKFSFLLGTPAMAGAAVLEAKNLLASLNDPAFYAGVLSSAVVGCLAVKFLLAYLRTKGFGIFATYRLVLAATLVFYLSGS